MDKYAHGSSFFIQSYIYPLRKSRGYVYGAWKYTVLDIYIYTYIYIYLYIYNYFRVKPSKRKKIVKTCVMYKGKNKGTKSIK